MTEIFGYCSRFIGPSPDLVVWADVEGHDPQPLKRGDGADGHADGGVNRCPCAGGATAGAHESQLPRVDALTQGSDEAGVGVHGAEEAEGVAATNEQSLSFTNGCHLAEMESDSGRNTLSVIKMGR